jgi:hypothetical protein
MMSLSMDAATDNVSSKEWSNILTKPFLEKLLHIKIRSRTFPMNNILTFAVNLKTLWLVQNLQTHHLRSLFSSDEVKILAQSMSRLEYITLVEADLRDIRYFSGHGFMTRIELYSCYYITEEQMETMASEAESSLAQFLRGRGSALTLLKIYSPLLCGTPCLGSIGRIAPKLVTLHLYVTGVERFKLTAISWKDLGLLSSLRDLFVTHVMMTHEDVQSMARGGCHRLNVLRIRRSQMMVTPRDLVSGLSSRHGALQEKMIFFVDYPLDSSLKEWNDWVQKRQEREELGKEFGVIFHGKGL